MGLFTRLSDIVNANINAMLDRAEDPEKIIGLIIQEMEDTLVEVRSSAVKTIAERKELDRRLASAHGELAEWQAKAEFALTKGREDMAKAALVLKARLQEEITQLSDQLGQIDAALAAQNEDVGKLQAKLEDAKARRQSLTARAKTAGNRLRMRSQLYDARIADAFSRFEQVERSLDTLEGRAESLEMGRARSLDEQFAELQAEAAVEEELAKLKRKMAGSETPAA